MDRACCMYGRPSPRAKSVISVTRATRATLVYPCSMGARQPCTEKCPAHSSHHAECAGLLALTESIPSRRKGVRKVATQHSSHMARHRPKGVGVVGRDLTSGGSGSGTRIITAASFEVAAIISTFLPRWHLPHGVGRPTADDVLLFNLYDVCGRVVAR